MGMKPADWSDVVLLTGSFLFKMLIVFYIIDYFVSISTGSFSSIFNLCIYGIAGCMWLLYHARVWYLLTEKRK